GRAEAEQRITAILPFGERPCFACLGLRLVDHGLPGTRDGEAAVLGVHDVRVGFALFRLGLRLLPLLSGGAGLRAFGAGAGAGLILCRRRAALVSRLGRWRAHQRQLLGARRRLFRRRVVLFAGLVLGLHDP